MTALQHVWIPTFNPEWTLRADRVIAFYPVLGTDPGGKRPDGSRWVGDSTIWARVEPSGEAVEVGGTASEHIARSLAELLAVLADTATRDEPLLYVVHRLELDADGALLHAGGRWEATPTAPVEVWETDLFGGPYEDTMGPLRGAPDPAPDPAPGTGPVPGGRQK